MKWYIIFMSLATTIRHCTSGDILMITMSGTKSHKIPFWELARGLTNSGHNITFLSAFPPDFHMEGVEEITPASLVFYVKNFTNWDLVGARMRGEHPVSIRDTLRFGVEACESLLDDIETKSLLERKKTYDLIILDGAYPECALGFVYHYKIPFIYVNTVGFYTAGISLSGSPTPYSVTPFFGKAFTNDMSFIERGINGFYHIASLLLHSIMVNLFLQNVLRSHFGMKMPHVYDMSRNVSLILQNGHYSVSYPRAYLPNVIEVACIHCKSAKPLSRDLEDFITSGTDAGFVYVSMGSSVKAASMPSKARRILLRALGQLPYKVLWKYEGNTKDFPNLPSNIKLSKWLPQQDLLGHPKIKAFVTHGGLLSMYETVYHGVPVVSIPVFCDHDANAAKAEIDGYAKVLELRTLTAEQLYNAIIEVIHKPSYRNDVKRRQLLLKDQAEAPLNKAVYWVEYVIRHNGAYHLQSPAKDLNYFQYHMLDVISAFFILVVLFYILVSFLLRILLKKLTDQIVAKQITVSSKVVIKKQL